MTAPTALPAPRSNLTATGFSDSAADITGTDLIVAVGDYTGGAAEDLFTLAAHGLVTGDYVYLLYKVAVGAVTGAVGTRFRVKVLSSSTFQLTNDSGTIIENTADGAVVAFLKALVNTPSGVVTSVIIPRLIVAAGDFTGGTTEDMFTPSVNTGYAHLEDTNQLKLLYKSAAGVVTGIAAGTTVFAKSVTTAAFELSDTSGGADIENTADGTAIFLKLT